MDKYFEALERLAMPDELHISECKKLGVGLTEDYDLLEQALLNAEKEHNALEIIKKKNVSVCGFRNRVFGYHSNMTINDTYEYYLNYFGCYHNGFDVELLTKEQFNLLKEVLK